jgi:hypothetical protein
MATKPPCIIDGCARESYCRGLCSPCYMRAIQLMKEDPSLNWRDLEDMRLAKRSLTSPFMIAYQKALQKKADGQ